MVQTAPLHFRMNNLNAPADAFRRGIFSLHGEHFYESCTKNHFEILQIVHEIRIAVC